LAFLKLFGKIEKMTQLAIKPNIFFDLATLIFATLLQKQKKTIFGMHPALQSRSTSFVTSELFFFIFLEKKFLLLRRSYSS